MLVESTDRNEAVYSHRIENDRYGRSDPGISVFLSQPTFELTWFRLRERMSCNVSEKPQTALRYSQEVGLADSRADGAEVRDQGPLSAILNKDRSSNFGVCRRSKYRCLQSLALFDLTHLLRYPS